MLLDSFQFHARLKGLLSVAVVFNYDVDALASIALLRLFFRMHNAVFSLYPMNVTSYLTGLLDRLSNSLPTEGQSSERAVLLINIGATLDLSRYVDLHIYIIDYLRPASLANVISEHVLLLDEGLILGSLLLSFFPQKTANILHDEIQTIARARHENQGGKDTIEQDLFEGNTNDTNTTGVAYKKQHEMGDDDEEDEELVSSLEQEQEQEKYHQHPFEESVSESSVIPDAASLQNHGFEQLGLPLQAMWGEPENDDEHEFSDSVNKESTEASTHLSESDNRMSIIVSGDTELTNVSMGAAHRQVDAILRETEEHQHEATAFEHRGVRDLQLKELLDTSTNFKSQSETQSIFRRSEDGEDDSVAAAFALLQKKAVSQDSVEALKTLSILYRRLPETNMQHIYASLSALLSAPSKEQKDMIAEYAKLRAVSSPSTILLYNIISSEAKRSLSVSLSLMVTIQWHAMIGAAGAFIMQRCTLQTLQKLLESCMATVKLPEKKFNARCNISIPGIKSGAKGLTLDEVIDSAHRFQNDENRDARDIKTAFSVASEDDVSADQASMGEASGLSILSQGSRVSSTFSTTDGNMPTLMKSMHTPLTLHSPLPYAVISDPFLYCMRLTSLYNALLFTNPSLLRSIFDSYSNNQKFLKSATICTMANFFCNMNGFNSELYQRNWSEQDNATRFFILSQYTACVKRTSAPWRAIPFVPNMVYMGETNLEVSAFDAAYILEGLLMLLPTQLGGPPMENLRLSATIVNTFTDLNHIQLFMAIYKYAFAGPDEFLELVSTKKFQAIFHKILDVRSDILHHTQRAYLSYWQRHRKVDSVSGLHVAEVAAAQSSFKPLIATKITAEFRLLCTHMHLSVCSRKAISFRFKHGCTDLRLIAPHVSQKDAARWRKYIHFPAKASLGDTLQRQSVVLVLKGTEYALVSGSSVRENLFNAWIANSIPTVKELLLKGDLFTKDCVEHDDSLVYVPIQATFTVLPVVKGFMAAKLSDENARVKAMIDKNNCALPKEKETSQYAKERQTEADDIDSTTNGE